METADTTTTQQETFNRLKAILEPYAPQMVVVKDLPGNYYLDTHQVMKNKKPLFFAMVTIGKSYVSLHFFPVYVRPALLEGISEGLRARMQGKACFNFKRVDEVLFEEMAALVQTGFELFQSPELLEDVCRR